MKTRIAPKRLMMAAGGLAALLVSAATAWACSGQSSLFILDAPPVTSSNTHLIVRGDLVPSSATEPVPASAQIRWNAVGGPSLADITPAHRAFQAQVQIPQVSPGVYYMVLVSGEKQMASLAVQVVPASGQGSKFLASVSQGTWSASSPGYQASTSSHGIAGQLGVALLALGLGGVSVTGAMLATMRRRRAAKR